MKNKLAGSLLLLLTLLTTSLYAQRPSVDMADAMRANGKIYVVVTVLGIIFAGIVIYLIAIDRKLRKLEKKEEE